MAKRNGTTDDDELIGGDDSDFLIGNRGNDELFGGLGEDRLSGGLGDDTLNGGSGEDHLVGGAGDDRMNGGADDDDLDAGSGDDVAMGGSGDDELEGGDGQDFLTGGSGDDDLTWDPDDLRVDGGVGFDTLLVSGGRVDLGAQTTLRNIEAIDLRGDGPNVLFADAAAVITATDSRRLLRVFGDSDDALELGGTWSRVRSPVEGFTRFVSGGAKVDVANAVQVLYGNNISLANLNGVNGMRLIGAYNSSSTSGDINGDGLDDLLLGAPKTWRERAGGNAYLVFGKANSTLAELDLNAMTARQGVRLSVPRAENYAGTSVSIIGDVNHDGFTDFAVASGTMTDFFEPIMKSYVIFGRGGAYPTTMAMQRVNGDNGYILDGIPNDLNGSNLPVGSAGDFNGDGFDDLVLGVPTAPTPLGPAQDAGSAFIVFGAAAPYDRSVDIRVLGPEEGWRINGADRFNMTGWVLSSGDVNGDGFDDLVLGGAKSHVVFGKAAGFEEDLSLGSLDGDNGFRISGTNQTIALTSLDINGDGFDDVAIGDSRVGGPITRVIFGHSGSFGTSVNAETLTGFNGFTIVAPARERAGLTLGAAGDVNGDGYEDLLVGLPHAPGSHQVRAGAVYLVFGRAGGFDAQLNLADLTLDQGVRLGGFAKDQMAGWSVSSAGDVNGDGFADVVIGALSQPGFGPLSFLVYGRDFNHTVEFNGTKGSDTLTGTAADESLVGGRGRDLLDGAGGSDALIGGANDDTLVYDPLDHRVDGGAGFDTLRFTGADQTLDLTLLPSRTLTGMNAVDLTGTGANHLRLTLQDLLQFTDKSALRVLGDADDTVAMTTSGWTQIGDQTLGGVTYDAWVHGSVTLLVDSEVTTTIS